MLTSFFKGYVRCNNFSTNEFLMSNSFIYREFDSVAIFNIPHKNALSRSYPLFHFSFSFYEYSFFINSVFFYIFNVNSVTNIFNNDLHVFKYIYLIGIIGFYYPITKWQGCA